MDILDQSEKSCNWYILTKTKSVCNKKIPTKYVIINKGL